MKKLDHPLDFYEKYTGTFFGGIKKDIRLTGNFRLTECGLESEPSLNILEYECLDPDNKTIWIEIENLQERR
jgi:hypothetical protein